MNAQPKSGLFWRLARWALLGIAVITTLVAVLVTEENWRGKHAWENYRRAAESRGEHFDWAAMAPANVPDDQNFLAAPHVIEFLTNGATFSIYRGDGNLWPAHGGNWQKGTMTDLAEWPKSFRAYNRSPEGQTNGFPVSATPQSPAAEVLQALSVYDSALETLRAASVRPAARWPYHYENGFEEVGTLLPSLASEKRVAQFLQLRILAELQANQPDAALTDTKVLLRLIDSLRNQPFLISHLVALAVQAIAMQPIYEGLAQHCWNDAQLAELLDVLGQKDYLADFQYAMRGERTCAIAEFEKQRITRRMLTSGGPDGLQLVTNNLTFMPSAYFYQNQLAFARMYDQLILPMVNLTNNTVSVTAYHNAGTEITNLMKHASPYTFQALALFPAVGKTVMKFAMIQAQVDLARTACALERYRLAHGNYPATLDELTPQFIAAVPHDVINGQPLHYRRTDNGKYVLYSIGWDEKDDGGQVVLSKEGNANWQKGDWVWKY